MENYKPPPGYEDSNDTKGKGKKKKKDPNAPKRATTAFMFYSTKMRPIIKEDKPDIKFTEMGKLIGEKWRELSDDDKKEFEDLAEKDKQRYADEMAKYNDKKQAEEDGMEDEADEGDIEDKVDDLEAELEDLRAEFEKLLGDDEDKGEDDAEELDLDEPMDMDMDMEPEMEETVDYDIEESVEEEVVEEATKLSDAVAEPKGGEADSNESSLTKAPKKEAIAGASPVKSKDGGDGNKGESAKDHTPTDNINVDQKKV